MTGTLLMYDKEHRLSMFVDDLGLERYDSAVMFVGGLGDGLNAVPYIVVLRDVLGSINWGLAQPLLRSSYGGYGTCSLSTDVEDLSRACEVLAQRFGIKRICLLGHSTGCQDIVWFMRHASAAALQLVKGVILQAPVSDRDYMAELPATKGAVAAAKALVRENRADDLLPVAFGWDVPITARRYLSLATRGSDEDMFSDDLSESELDAALAPLRSCRALLVTSGDDEYIPSRVDKQALLERLARAAGADHVLLEGADHAITDYDPASAFAQELRTFLHKLTPHPPMPV